MGKLLLDQPESSALVATWADSGLLGYRVSFPPGQTWLEDGAVEWLWRASEEQGFPVMIWAPRQLDGIGDAARRYPGARLVIDHFGLAVDDKDQAVEDVVRELVQLAPIPNVAVKASGLPGHTSEPYPFRNLHASVREVIDAFGAPRVFWGTDLTTLPCPYVDALRMFTEAIDLPSDQVEQIVGLGICRWLRWNVPSPRLIDGKLAHRGQDS
jgi:hypothetical protein